MDDGLYLIADRLARLRASFDPVEFQRRIAAAPSAEARMELQAQYAANLRAIARAENYLMQQGFLSAGAAPSFFTEQENKAAQNVDQMLSPDYGVQLEPPAAQAAAKILSPDYGVQHGFPAAQAAAKYQTEGRWDNFLGDQAEQARARVETLMSPLYGVKLEPPPRKPGRSLPGSELQDFYRERPPSIASRFGQRGQEETLPRTPEPERSLPGARSPAVIVGPRSRMPAGQTIEDLRQQAAALDRNSPYRREQPTDTTEPGGVREYSAADVLPPFKPMWSPAEIGEQRKAMNALMQDVKEKHEAARKGISDITLEKPTFEEGFGKIDPGMALALAGLSMFQPGKSAAEAISSGAKTGLMQLSEDRKLAAAQQREMREAQRQFVSDSLGQAKTLADIDLRSSDAELKVQDLIQRHEEAIRRGNYQDASLLLDRARLEVSRSATPGAMANELAALEAVIENEKSSPQQRQDATRKLKYLQGLTRAGTTELGQSRLAADIMAKVDADLKNNVDYMGLSPEDQKKFRSIKLLERFKAAGLVPPSASRRTELPPDYE